MVDELLTLLALQLEIDKKLIAAIIAEMNCITGLKKRQHTSSKTTPVYGQFYALTG